MFFRNVLIVLGLVLVVVPAGADTRQGLSFLVTDQHSEPLANAVVYALPDNDKGSASPAIMDQVDHAFVPHVLPVQRGAAVDFPNSDDVRHHVYSFSEAKTFELPLYSGVPSDPVVFDQAGEVVLGCNIHDQMLGYIYVVETSVFARSGPDGRVRLDGLPAAATAVHFWHPRSDGPSKVIELADLIDRDESVIDVEISVSPERDRHHDHGHAGDSEASDSPGLEDRFRRFRTRE
ncbi:methylamine utilization protein [Thioalkalivibrio sp. ALJ1]|uniref:methylamine utilization protein n=1 Tax=Thioalkalivibrio sp. ALJ1 TaxID=1158144 RepID=UPI000AACF21A|nr:methylamine utilization protein [Thioalkalivibrio sp. ALJ1]